MLLYRLRGEEVEVFLVHPGGPFWARKDRGAWSIPKGEFRAGEDPFAAALREFEEETGVRPEGRFQSLVAVRQRGGKIIHAWAVAGDIDAEAVVSNTFSMEWPPGSGRQAEFPEVDRAAWFTLVAAKEKIAPGQVPLLEELERILKRAID